MANFCGAAPKSETGRPRTHNGETAHKGGWWCTDFKELQAAKQDNPTKTAAKPIIIKKGKSTFCHMRQSNKVIRLEFQSVDEAEHIQEQIHNFLKSLAKDGV